MTLLLDGYKVQGKALRVSANLRIESEDLSGQTSHTGRAHKGFKPKSLSVSLIMPYRDRQHLTELIGLAEATTPDGQLKTYRLVNDSAEAFGIRQVQFSDNLSIREDDNLHAWQVQFGLIEQHSVPEKIEARRAPPEGRTTPDLASVLTQLQDSGERTS